MADVTELRMNVTALKRVDPYAKDIIETARHVAYYSFNSDENEWERTSVEGALFIYSRNGEPYHGILIVNRLNKDNLVEPVVSGLDLQLQEPFLLYRNSDNSIRGFWFYDKEDCVKVAQLLQRLIADLQVPATTSQPEMIQNTQQNQNSEPVDIFGMLSRAQEDFNIQNNPQGFSNQPEHLQQPPKPDVTSQSVMDFFAKATNSTTASVPRFVAPRAPAEQLIPERQQHIIHRLMSNPEHSVEHIEKRQRCVTPQDVRHDERRGFPMQPLSSSTMAEVPTVSLAQPPGFPVEHKTILIENGLSFMRVSSPNQGQSLNAFFSSKNTNTTESDSRPLSAPLIETPQKPALMPPTMFTASSHKDSRQPLLDQGDITIKLEPLTRNQLLQAITYLLKTEPDFINKLHEAYLKSFNEIVH